MKKDKFFIDTNIWFFAFMKNDPKNKTANILISGANIVLSTDVLNELCLNLINVAGYSEIEITNLIKNMYRKFDILKINEEVLLQASILREKYKLDYWVSIRASLAILNECKVLFTDKIKETIIIEDKLKLLNPFE